MKLEEVISWPGLLNAAAKVWLRFQFIPGFYLEMEDLTAVGAMSAWQLGSRLETIPAGLLYTVLHRDMYDHARRSIDFPRSRLTANNFSTVESLDELREVGFEPKAYIPTAYDYVLDGELVGLIDDERTGLTEKEATAARHFFVDDNSQAEMAARMGVCRSRIAQLIAAATRKLQRRAKGTRNTPIEP